MLSFVLATSALNILLGAGLALLVMTRAKSAHEQTEQEGAVDHVPLPTPAPIEPLAPLSPPPTQPVKFLMEDLPPAWIEKLASESGQAKSMVEASTLVLRLEVGRYRESLVDWEDKIRAIPNSEFSARIHEPIAEIVKLNEDWLKIQTEAVDLLAGKSASLDNFREISNCLEEILLGQTAQIESTANNLVRLRMTDPPAELRIVVVRELQRLIDLAQRLRDAIHVTLHAILIAENRVERAEKKLTTDAQTQLLSPIGLECVFEHWKRDDPSRKKLVCVGILGLDQFKNFNESLGTRFADALLDSVAQLCAQTIRKDRGFDRIARLGGDTLAIFYGDMSIQNCVMAMERLRQTLRQSTFLLEKKEIKLSASFAIAALLKSDSLSLTLDRAAAALQIAKSKARDGIVIDEGKGAEIAAVPSISVRPVKVPVTTTVAK